jgi:hypothetical protein
MVMQAATDRNCHEVAARVRTAEIRRIIAQ